MSEECLLYGCIEGPNAVLLWKGQIWRELWKRNVQSIQALPDSDQSPPLTRWMFCVPTPDRYQDLYRVQAIPFAASVNHMSDLWPEWLDKFEGLLRRLYWQAAHVRLSIELHGEFQYLWKADPSPYRQWREEPLAPVGTWTFSGGPREFSS